MKARLIVFVFGGAAALALINIASDIAGRDATFSYLQQNWVDGSPKVWAINLALLLCCIYLGLFKQP